MQFHIKYGSGSLEQITHIFSWCWPNHRIAPKWGAGGLITQILMKCNQISWRNEKMSLTAINVIMAYNWKTVFNWHCAVFSQSIYIYIFFPIISLVTNPDSKNSMKILDYAKFYWPPDSMKNTWCHYLGMQWAAVTMCLSSISAPPQNCRSINDPFLSYTSAAIQGWECEGVTMSPPTITKHRRDTANSMMKVPHGGRTIADREHLLQNENLTIFGWDIGVPLKENVW